MAIREHLEVQRQGVEAWNAWRVQNPDVRPNLSEASFSGMSLSGADLSGTNLIRAGLVWADLRKANLRKAKLRKANLSWARLSGARLCGADLRKAKLRGADLSGARFPGAVLSGADLERTVLIKTNLVGADLTGCRVYGISAWDLELDEDTKQKDLIVTPRSQPEITADNLEVAQFIYLMLYNKKIRHVIDTITSKVVLILGRFAPPERKAVLDALRDELRRRDYLPVLFDFEKPANRTTDETITLLARMARFVVADISDAKSVLQELRAIAEIPSVPVQPVIVATQEEPGMFDFFYKFRHFLNAHSYDSQEQLIADLSERVIKPAEAKVHELRAAPPAR